MALAFDEYGRPFIILNKQESKSMLRGLDAQKANISAGVAVSRILRTSLDPKGMDKMLKSPDGDITIMPMALSAMKIHQPSAQAVEKRACRRNQRLEIVSPASKLAILLISDIFATSLLIWAVSDPKAN